MNSEQKDITGNKSNRIIQVKQEFLPAAAVHAIIEAGKWADAVGILRSNRCGLESQICVLSLLSIELYLKAIQMKKGSQPNNHSINELYSKLSTEEKEILKEGIVPDGVVPSTLLDEYIQLDTFEKELEYIDRDFVYLRYEYEKFSENQPIFVLDDFILQLLENSKKLATSIVFADC